MRWMYWYLFSGVERSIGYAKRHSSIDVQENPSHFRWYTMQIPSVSVSDNHAFSNSAETTPSLHITMRLPFLSNKLEWLPVNALSREDNTGLQIWYEDRT